ncbi:MAG: tRNA (N(6)-L-threonylcarbamoyladenosine(37)-C(2))-methylthiotransferase MtaB [Clostridiales bacterium]|nr:tRNA (N(6)-L-threonylcarbamoyladenosine(37)-C(2))-methylthiotransferase MtaB [Clostridiales bacterium]
MKIAFYTLGCKVNQYETEAMAERAERCGYTLVNPDEKADVYVINSCTVTAESDRKTRQAVRKFKRANPGSVVVLTGCVPQAYPEIAEELTQADIVMGNRNNHALDELLTKHALTHARQVEIIEHKKGDAFTGDTVTGAGARTRVNIKIEDGCNRFCSYCAIPYSRGRVRSKPLDVLAGELKAVNDAGFLEVVLVGINLSAYGSDTGKSLCDAVELAASFDNIKRVRLGSLEPDHLTPDVVARLSQIEKLCPQFHISLQSGCDSVLKRMNRHYTAEEYAGLCRDLRESFPDATLTTDVMVGFPGESEEDFKTSLEFVKKIGFEKIHVFAYSRRKGTPAAEMPDQIPKAEKENRSRRMITAAGEIRDKFLSAQIGKTVSVLIEEKTEGGVCHGYTPNYTPVKVPGYRGDFNRLVQVKITSAEGDFAIGEEI